MTLRIELPDDFEMKKDDEIIIRFNSKAGQHGYSVITKTQDEMEKMEKSKPNRGVKLGDYAKKIRQRLKDNYQYRTADINQCTMKSFMKFRKQKDILLCELDELVVGAYESYLKHQGLTLNTISFYMRRLRAIYNSAVKELEIPDRKPFAGAFTRTTKTSKRAISQKAIRQLAQLKLETYNQQFARDLFLFSYYTRGMSFVDIACLEKSNIRNGYLIYKRRKTGQELRIAWRQSMQDIVDRYPSLDGKHLLGILDNHAEKSLRQQRHYRQCLINKTLKKLSKLIDIDITLTMYVARHSWATNAKEKNVPVSVISDSMGHNSEKTTQIYLKSINADQIDQTNDILIDAITK